MLNKNKKNRCYKIYSYSVFFSSSPEQHDKLYVCENLLGNQSDSDQSLLKSESEQNNLVKWRHNYIMLSQYDSSQS